MKNAFYFILKALFVLKVQFLHFCPDFFGRVGKRLAKKAKFNSKIYDVIDWETNNHNTNIAPISQEVKAVRR